MADETRSLLAHLFRRAAFGATKAELDLYSARGYDAAVSDLVSASPGPTARPGGAVAALGGSSGGMNLGMQYSAQAIREAQAAWIQAMVTSNAPLAERMTLFYADHFATAFNPADEIDVQQVVDQLATLRKFSLGSFRGLTHALLDDMALACSLDNDVNTKKAPNENLARELMELYTLGAGNFTERDVKETARSLTGYVLQKSGTSARGKNTYKLTYDPSRHDDGVKTVLGSTGFFTPHEVLDVILSQPAAPEFLATKLVGHFVSAQPDSGLVLSVARSLSSSNWSLTAALRTVFSSAQFKSPSVRETLVKSPAEFVVGALRALDRTEYSAAILHMEQAGQTLFSPPNVGGWPSGEGWLGVGTMLARYNAAVDVGNAHGKSPAATTPGASADLTTWMETLGMTSLAPSTRTAVENYQANMSRQSEPLRRAGIATMLLASPDFNLS